MLSSMANLPTHPPPRRLPGFCLVAFAACSVSERAIEKFYAGGPSASTFAKAEGSCLWWKGEWKEGCLKQKRQRLPRRTDVMILPSV